MLIEFCPLAVVSTLVSEHVSGFWHDSEGEVYLDSWVARGIDSGLDTFSDFQSNISSYLSIQLVSLTQDTARVFIHGPLLTSENLQGRNQLRQRPTFPCRGKSACRDMRRYQLCLSPAVNLLK